MRILSKIFVPILLAILVLLPVTQADQVAAASKFKDGEYNLPFNIYKSGSSETSAAADYLSSAKLIVKDGKNIVQMNVSNSSMLKSLTVNGVTASTVSSNEAADTRVVQFSASNIDGQLGGTMHVVVPKEQLPPNGYDKNHSVNFSFNTSGIPTADGSGGQGEEANSAAGEVKPEENPPTGDNAPILLFSIVLLASGFVLVRKVAFK